MGLKAPTPDELEAITAALSLSIAPEDVDAVRADIQGALDGFYPDIDAAPDFVPEVKYPRTPGVRPDAEADPLHAWFVKTSIAGADDGPLAGRRVAVKDNVLIAGVPMMNGATTLEGYVPDVDATIVTRLLDAGAEIVGKTHCEYFCASGGSHTNATGATRNPRATDRSAGGSSSGSAAVIAAGEADLAVGGDQGGSIRVPAAFCGVYGMKPTYGLVPYTGVMPVEHTLDHVGPITGTVRDNALMLSVIAGRDDLDPRQGVVTVGDYLENLDAGVKGLRIGLLDEGFGWDVSDGDVDHLIHQVGERLGAAGAEVSNVSVPEHRSALGVLGLRSWLKALPICSYTETASGPTGEDSIPPVFWMCMRSGG